MAYIDKEKLEQFINRYDWGTCDERWRPESEFGKFVDAIPTADVAEVKHGEWEYVSKHPIIQLDNAREQLYTLGHAHRNQVRLRCSECHKSTFVDDSIAYKWCPHCGAKMDGGDVG